MKPFDLRAEPNGWSAARVGVFGEGERVRKHIDMRKRYGNGIQRSALSPAANYPPSSKTSLLPLPINPAEIASLITPRNILLRALCNITYRGMPRLLQTDRRHEITIAFPIQDTLRNSNHSAMICMYIRSSRQDNLLFLPSFPCIVTYT